MNPIIIDINCDVGEGVSDEAKLFPYITSCSIACGGHAGDVKSIKRTALLAKKHGVRIGAHPSYPDKENFGRKMMDISAKELMASITFQIKLFKKIILGEGMRMHHIKPHGALYNTIAKNKNEAITFLEAIETYRAEAVLYVPPKSRIAEEADRRGFRIKFEGFGDRNYNDDLTLVSRQMPNAVIENSEKVLQHIVSMTKHGVVQTVSGLQKTITAQTFCIHGDNAKALQILMYLTKELPKSGIRFRK